MKKLPARIHTLVTMLLAVAFFTSTTYAATPAHTYQVNVIVFKHANSINLLPETFKLPFSVNPEGIYLNPMDETVTADDYPAYTLQPYNQFGMKESLLRLFKQPNYQVLLAFSWWQSFDSKDDVKTINILGGQASDPLGNPLDSTQLAWLAQQPVLFAPLRWELNGQLTLRLNRYFELALNMQLMQTQDTAISLTDEQQFTPYQVFTLKQTIRARSKKIYYFDNPAFGVIVKLIPITTPSTTVTNSTTDKEV